MLPSPNSIPESSSESLGERALRYAGSLALLVPPQSQIFGPVMSAPPRPGEVALTFDDGPNPAWTPQLLEVLAAHEVRATFFLIGNFAVQQPRLVWQIHSAGHLIGNHTWSHPNLAGTTAAKTREELLRTSGELEAITGSAIRYFRPPYGLRRPATLRVARELGLTPVTWNCIGNDWNAPSIEAIVDRVTRLIDRHQRRGFATNLVLHDGGHKALGADRSRTVAATAALLHHYRQIRSFVTFDSWPAPGKEASA